MIVSLPDCIIEAATDVTKAADMQDSSLVEFGSEEVRKVIWTDRYLRELQIF